MSRTCGTIGKTRNKEIEKTCKKYFIFSNNTTFGFLFAKKLPDLMA